jgi:uncharacterized membrane protein YciS (DUF1049 family)
MNSYLKYIGLSFGALILGLFMRTFFVLISLEQLSNGSMAINVPPRTNDLGVLFVLSTGLIPVLTLISIKISNSTKIQESITILLLILISGIVSWQLRIIYLSHRLEQLAQISDVTGITGEYRSSDLKLDIYFAMGLAIGTIMSGLTLRILKKIKTKGNNGEHPQQL